MRPFEVLVTAELTSLLRAGVPVRGVHIAVREMVVTRIERHALGVLEVSETVEGAVRAAGPLVRELDASEELAEIVCRSALEGVRATAAIARAGSPRRRSTIPAVLVELARERPDEAT
jgi:hypothetical protein